LGRDGLELFFGQGFGVEVRAAPGWTCREFFSDGMDLLDVLDGGRRDYPQISPINTDF
jgi:hypothetical protein